jgi:uncharacterized protein involved in exopolysaccharide biosynthesis
MKFSELEKVMSEKGVNSLADISRALNTTPQAVSNWKARNQVPYHILGKLNQLSSLTTDSLQASATPSSHSSPITFKEDTSTLYDILLIVAEQLKIIVLVPFISIFLTFTYVKFIQQPKYVSWATVLLPSNASPNIGGLSGLAAQFGVNVPTSTKNDLSSPSLFPELLKSRTFTEKIIDREFYSEEYGRKLSLLAILAKTDNPSVQSRDVLITKAMGLLSNMIQLMNGTPGSISTIRVTADNAIFAKDLAEVVLEELELLNRELKTKSINEKTIFIENRIISVNNELLKSEKNLKSFREKNRQISSPSLQLLEERINREVEVQKGIYLTLKQQLELAKIEEVQEASIVQILDRPQLPIGASNINLRLSVILAGFFGLALAIFIAFIRSYANNPNIDERKKLRRGKLFIKKKLKDLLIDYRVSGIVSFFFLSCSPFFLSHKSAKPEYFNFYSKASLIINIIYICIALVSTLIFIKALKKRRES